MSGDDLLARAEALREDLEDGLIAEIKRLKSFADDLMDNCNILRNRAQQAEAQLQAIVYDDEAPEWAKDYHLLHSALDGPIVDAARKWHLAYRMAQNSNLVRKQQNEQQAAYVARLEAAYLAARRTIEWDAIDRDELNRHYTNISAPWMDAKTKGDLFEPRPGFLKVP